MGDCEDDRLCPRVSERGSQPGGPELFVWDREFGAIVWRIPQGVRPIKKGGDEDEIRLASSDDDEDEVAVLSLKLIIREISISDFY